MLRALFFILKILKHVPYIPLWHLQALVKRNNNIWIFGAWYGKRYSDNCRTLFEYINELEETKILPVWLSKNKDDIKFIRSLGYNAYSSRSFKGIWWSLKAGIIIYSSTKDDVNRYFINGAKLINLWHGAPLKKVERGITPTKNYSRKLKVFKFLLPWLYPYNIDNTIVLSPYFIEMMHEYFGVDQQNIIISGFPRNDNLFSNSSSDIIRTIKGQFHKTRVILYMPTFRDYDRSYNYFEGFDFEKLQNFLQQSNSVFLFKGHYASEAKFDFSSYSRILDYDSYCPEQELYIHIKEVDVLITDYSSIFFDFLMLDKPILFAPFDLHEYLHKAREMNCDYEKAVPGPICNDWDEVLEKLDSFIKEELEFQKNNFLYKNKYHQYQDGNSSKRVFEEIRSRYC